MGKSAAYVALLSSQLASLCAVSAGFAASTPFLRGLLDKWHIKPLGFAREEYKSVVSQYTDKEYNKANKEATKALLHSWMAQIVTDVAAARGMTTAQVGCTSSSVVHAMDKTPIAGRGDALSCVP